MLEPAFRKMSSHDYVTQIQGIDETLPVMDQVFSEVVRILNEAGDSLFVAERISYLFESLRKKLDVVFNQTENIDLKVNIALIYLTNDNFSKVTFLLDYIETTSDMGNATFCLMKLAAKGIVEAQPLIEQWIRKVDTSNFDDEIKKEDCLSSLKNASERLNNR